MDREPMLVCVDGSLAGRRYPITSEGLRIGRDAGNEIVLEDAGVSRQHARVLLHNGAVWVQDAGSRNGIFVNGERVPDHRAMKTGDKLLVGGTTFAVSLEDAAPVRTAPAAPPPAASGTGAAALPTPTSASLRPKADAPAGWKAWPFVVAVLLALSAVACIGLLAGGSDAPAASAPPAPAYELSSVLADKATTSGTAGPAATEAPAAGAPSVAQALAVAAGADDASSRNRLPEPPAGVTSAELVDRGHAAFDAGRLNEARTNYQMALRLDPACNICSVRITKLDTQITAQAQSQLDAGTRYFDTLQYAEAETAFQTVLLLVPDTSDPLHVRAVEALDRTRAAARGAGSGR